MSKNLIAGTTTTISESGDDISVELNSTYKGYADNVDVILEALGLDSDTFDSTESYSSGDLVIYNHQIWEFTTSHSGDWIGTDVDLVPIIDAS